MSPMPERSYSYRRVSTPGRQVRGDGLDRQDRYAEQLSKEHGWCLDDTLVFVDAGRSGFHGHNLKPTAALARFLELVKRGRITPGSVLIIENIDRLSRQDVDVAYDIFRGLLKAGIWIATKTPARIYKRENNSFMDLMEPIWLMYLAHQESLKKSDRVAAAWDTARKKAVSEHKPIPGNCPNWLRRTPTGYEAIPERAEAIRRIFKMAREGFGYHRLSMELNKAGVPAFGRSGQWTNKRMYTLLRGRQVIGEYRVGRFVGGQKSFTGEVIKGYYPAIISEEEWEQTQAAIDRRKGRAGRPGDREANLFTGLIFDGLSRKALSIRGKTTPYGRVAYLATAKTRGTSIAYGDVEFRLLQLIAQLRPADVLEPDAQQSEREARIGVLQGRMTALDHRKQTIQAALADPDQDAGSLLSVLRQITKEETGVATELQRLKLESTTGRTEALGEAQSLIELLDKAAGDEKAEIRRRIKATLPTVVSEIWMQTQPVNQRRQIVHIQVFLRSGQMRYLQLFPVKLHGVGVWDMAAWDLRHGPYVARNPKKRAKAVR